MLIAINPFKEVPLYGNAYIDAYKRKSVESPHVYAITDTAIREMIRGILVNLLKLTFEIQLLWPSLTITNSLWKLTLLSVCLFQMR